MEFLVRHRFIVFVCALALTGWFAYLVTTLRLYDDPNQWPPEDDPNVLLNNKLQLQFGGANLVTIMITRKDGSSIINPETLEKVKRITDKIMVIHGVIPYAIRSLSTVNARYLKGTDEELDAGILFADANRAPQSAEELKRTEFGIKNNAALRQLVAAEPAGDAALRPYVSPDWTSVIIQADFRTTPGNLREGLKLPTTDPIAIYKEINEIIAPENDAHHNVTAAGSPMIIGWVNSDGLPYLFWSFAIILAGIIFVLAFAFRSEIGIIPPLALGLASTMWAFGIQRLVEGPVLTSASALLAPFIMIAASASHSVIFLKRFLADELVEGVSKEQALAATLRQLFVPMIMALGTDLISFIVLCFVKFDNVRLLGQVPAFGLAAVVILTPTFIMPMLALWPERRLRALAVYLQQHRTEGTGLVYRLTARWIRPLIYNRRVQYGVLGGVVVLTLLSLSVWPRIEISQDNTYAIHNYLTRSWNSSQLYQMEMDIKRRFGAVYTLSFLAEGVEPGAVKTPQALKALDEFSKKLDEVPEVAAVVGLPFFIKIMNRFMNNDAEEAYKIPDGEHGQMAINEAIYFLTGAQAGSFDSVMDARFQNAMIVAFVTDTSRPTVEKVMGRTRELVAAWDEKATGVRLHAAGGSVGIASAFNESIRIWLILATLLSLAASLVAAGIMVRSFVGPFILMLPVTLGTIIWVGVVWLIGIEFNSNVTSALAIASGGVGIDAEIYLLYRFREEYVKDHDFRRALYDAFTLLREPLVFSFSALFFGCLSVSLVPLYVGYVGFTMALVLLFTFACSCIVGPVVWSLLQPKFVTRGVEENRTTASAAA